MSDYQSLLPRTSTALEHDLEQMGLLAGDLGKLDLSIINDPYKCPVSMLPWLAWSRHVDWFDNAWPERKKRSVIAGSPVVHLRKGTVESVRDVIRFAGYGEITFKKRPFWWLYNGVRYYNGTIEYSEHSNLGWAQYIIILELQVSTRQAQIIYALVRATAPARCELLEINYKQAIIYNGLHQYDASYTYGVD